MKNHTYYFFDDIINIKIFDPNEIKTDKKSYKNIVYHIGYVTIKDLSYATANSLIPLYLIINKINWFIEGSNGSKYLTLVPTNQSEEILK